MNAFDDHTSLLPPGIAREIDRACDRFEAQWQSAADDGSPPTIEEFVQCAEPELRSRLLRELIPIDFHYRRLRGERLRLSEYEQRFATLELDRLDAQQQKWLDTDDTDTEATRRAQSTAVPESSHRGSAHWALPARYQLIEELGRGGMGTVLRVIDTNLDRPLAIKVPIPTVSDRCDARLLAEARITGQLQHPGITPVHEVGRLGNGRPFFSMKLIEGRTLATMLRDRPSPRDNVSALLGVFEQIAQTIAFAHSRGVIHRDLKPQNVMVGEFGEVQVMDWGLAKRIDQSVDEPDTCDENGDQGTATGRADSARDVDTPDTPAAVTMPGQILGTVSYMSPEQALGQLDRIGKSSDVFGLGAILCDILTGAPPYPGDTHEARLQLAQRGELRDTFQRLDQCGAEPELIELAKKCLAVRVTDRLADAPAVAKGISSYLESVQERLKAAEIEQATSQVRLEEEGKRRRVRMTLIATVAALLSVAAILAMVTMQANARRRVREAKASISLEQAKELRDSRLWKQADTTLKQADSAIAGDATPELASQMSTLNRDLRMMLELERLRSLVFANYGILMGPTSSDQRRVTEETNSSYLKAFQDYDIDLQALDVDPAARSIRATAEPMRSELAAALDDWAFAIKNSETHREWQEKLKQVALAADRSDIRLRLRDAQRRQDVEALLALAASVDVKTARPQSVFLLVRVLISAGQQDRAIGLLKDLQRENPSDFWLNNELAIHLIDPAIGRYSEAIPFLSAAVALRPDSVESRVNLGNAFKASDRLDEAVAQYRRALEMRPDFALAHYNLAGAFWRMKEYDTATQTYRDTLRYAPDMAAAYYGIGSIFAEQQRLGEAEEPLKRAVAIDPDLGFAHETLGHVLRLQGKREEAVGHYDRAIALDPRPFLQGTRTLAAISAVTAAVGKDAPDHTSDIGQFRERARAWLETDLAFLATNWRNPPENAPAVLGFLRGWLSHEELAAVREPDQLAKLPTTEREAWEKFWKSVRTLSDEIAATISTNQK